MSVSSDFFFEGVSSDFLAVENKVGKVLTRDYEVMGPYHQIVNIFHLDLLNAKILTIDQLFIKMYGLILH